MAKISIYPTDGWKFGFPDAWDTEKFKTLKDFLCYKRYPLAKYPEAISHLSYIFIHPPEEEHVDEGPCDEFTLLK